MHAFLRGPVYFIIDILWIHIKHFPYQLKSTSELWKMKECHCTSVAMWSCPTSRCRSVAGRCSRAARWSPRTGRWRCPSQTAADAVSAHYWSAPPHPSTTGSQYAHHDNLTTTRTEFKYTTTRILHFYSIEASLTALKIPDPLVHSLRGREL